jgi:hypothetical protein
MRIWLILVGIALAATGEAASVRVAQELDFGMEVMAIRAAASGDALYLHEALNLAYGRTRLHRWSLEEERVTLTYELPRGITDFREIDEHLVVACCESRVIVVLDPEDGTTTHAIVPRYKLDTLLPYRIFADAPRGSVLVQCLRQPPEESTLGSRGSEILGDGVLMEVDLREGEARPLHVGQVYGLACMKKEIILSSERSGRERVDVYSLARLRTSPGAEAESSWGTGGEGEKLRRMPMVLHLGKCLIVGNGLEVRGYDEVGKRQRWARKCPVIAVHPKKPELVFAPTPGQERRGNRPAPRGRTLELVDAKRGKVRRSYEVVLPCGWVQGPQERVNWFGDFVSILIPRSGGDLLLLQAGTGLRVSPTGLEEGRAGFGVQL